MHEVWLGPREGYRGKHRKCPYRVEHGCIAYGKYCLDGEVRKENRKRTLWVGCIAWRSGIKTDLQPSQGRRRSEEWLQEKEPVLFSDTNTLAGPFLSRVDAKRSSRPDPTHCPISTDHFPVSSSDAELWAKNHSARDPMSLHSKLFLSTGPPV
jgi:hypothetical protein